MQIAKWNEINKSYIFAIRHFSAVRSNNLDIWTYLFQRQRPFTEKQEQEKKEVKEGIEEKSRFFNFTFLFCLWARSIEKNR